MPLVHNQKSYNFEQNEYELLRSTLDSINRYTQVVPISDLRDVSLNLDTLKTRNGYCFSEAGLVQLCTLVCSGLYMMVADLSGQNRAPGADTKPYSSVLAVELFNRVVTLRFDSHISGHQLVLNTQDWMIDGVVGPRYKYLPNVDFLSMAEDTLVPHGYCFHTAYLYGRQLAVRYTHPRPLVIELDAYSPGYHFANAEVGGRSLRGAPLLYRLKTGDWALGTYGEEGEQTRHSGADFMRKAAKIFGIVTAPREQENMLHAAAARLTRPLAADGGWRPRIRHLANTLARRNIPLRLATKAATNAFALGRSGEAKSDMMPEHRDELAKTRTLYDLFCAVISEGRGLPIRQREAVEQAGYALLAGRLKV